MKDWCEKFTKFSIFDRFIRFTSSSKNCKTGASFDWVRKRTGVREPFGDCVLTLWAHICWPEHITQIYTVSAFSWCYNFFQSTRSWRERSMLKVHEIFVFFALYGLWAAAEIPLSVKMTPASKFSWTLSSSISSQMLHICAFFSDWVKLEAKSSWHQQGSPSEVSSISRNIPQKSSRNVGIGWLLVGRTSVTLL